MRNKKRQERKYSQRVCFKDGIRKIDYVLVFETDHIAGFDDKDVFPLLTKEEKQAIKRKNFENNLKSEGLELEYIPGEIFQNTCFVLIHAPFSVLAKQAEYLSLKMPLREEERQVGNRKLERMVTRIFKSFSSRDEVTKRLYGASYYTAPFNKDRLECFVGSENPETFFDSAERSRLVYNILNRTSCLDSKNIGIEQMIRSGYYTAAYPIHDDYENLYEEDYTDRDLLNVYWASCFRLLKYQPLSLIKKYFGSRIAWYFAFAGFYTFSLLPISVIGVLCFTYGLLTSKSDILSNDICSKDGIGRKVLTCPSCDTYCDFNRLSASCMYSLLLHVFDNEASVLIAFVMSIYVTLFLECWKRYQAKLAWEWGLLDFEVDEENIRPEYQNLAEAHGYLRLNPVTRKTEPYLPPYLRIFKCAISTIFVLICIFLVIVLVLFVAIFRVKYSQWMYTKEFWKPYVNIITTVLAASIQLAIAFCFSYAYSSLALSLTIWECPRTQQDFDNSYAVKVYLFQFVNYYASIFYIAFVKGNLASVPGRRFFGFRPEECDPLGCMVELVIQLLIIMGGKQIWNQISEHVWPHVVARDRVHRLTKNNSVKREGNNRLKMTSKTSRWELDYALYPSSPQHLFYEYLRLVIQFGFVTLFVAALPIAPVFALVNNVVEIRLDAKKYIRNTRRQMPEHAKNIGIWMQILNLISKFAPLVNACIIAFTSDFIPRLVYIFYYSSDGTLYGYVNNSLSYYDASEIIIQKNNFINWTTVCRYRDFRKPPCTVISTAECDNELGYTNQWWIILVFRLVFILLFQQCLSLFKTLLAYWIPDIPCVVRNAIQRERYLSREALMSNISTARSFTHSTKSER